MKFLQFALAAVALTSSTSFAFTQLVAPRGAAVARCSSTPFVATRQLQVALSDPSADVTEAAAEDNAPLTTEDVVAALGENEGEEIAAPPAEEHKIYIGNLPYSATVDKVRALFDAADIPVLDVSLPTNPDRMDPESGMPSSKGFAFVTVESEDLIEKGVAALHQSDLDGRELRVNKLLPKEELQKLPKRNDRFNPDEAGQQKLYVGNLAFDASYDDIKDLFAEYGEIYDLYLPQRDGVPRGFGFVTMDKESAMAAMQAINGMEFMGRTLNVNEPLDKNEKSQQARQKRSQQFKIYVGNLAFSTTRDTLQGVFEEFGDVHDCYVPLDPNTMNPRGFAFVTMDQTNGEDAIAELDGLELDGRFIRVNEAQGKKKPSPSPRQSYNNNDGDNWYNDNNGNDSDGY